MIWRVRLRTEFEGREADLVLGEGKIAANRAACVGFNALGATPK